MTSDHLGSTRVVTRADGSVKERYDYLPFGEQIDSNHGSRSLVTGYVGSDGTRQKFTQKERDIESGLDYFGQRYYSSAQGRFTSTDSYDPALSRQVAANRDEAEEEFRKYLMQSQHWNRYPYVINNPLRYLDPNGEQELEAITRAVAKVAGALAKYRGIVGRGVTQAAVQTALELAFGPALDFKPGNLRYPHEIDFAKTVMYMEGKSFMGFGGPTEPGIDGLLYDPGFTLSLNLNPQAVSLTETGGTVGTILNRATLHETSASDAGYKKVDLYINATNKDVDVARMVDFAKGGKQNLLEITKRGVIKSITIVLKDGVVRIQDGKVYGGIAQ